MRCVSRGIVCGVCALFSARYTVALVLSMMFRCARRAVKKTDVPMRSLFSFSHIQSYFGKVNENNIRANFVLIYELFDEMCDNGYPRITSANTLKEFITQKASVMDIIEGKVQGGLNKGENGQTKSKDEKEEAMNKLAESEANDGTDDRGRAMETTWIDV